MSNPINIGNRRELFWDEYLIDTANTTAVLKLHHLQPKEAVLRHDEPWESKDTTYYNILKDDGLYRLYYVALKPAEKDPVVICYAESIDGITWVKPKLGICEFDGLKRNNIILDSTTANFDNFSVLKDPNPDCPPEERYKGVGIEGEDHYLWCFTSADAIHFKKAWRMTNQGLFDTLNIAFWNKYEENYYCYIRDYHGSPTRDKYDGIRDIRRMTSKDFKNWSEPVLLDFGGGDDYPLYTNVVQQYYRNDRMLIGFPSRYVERKEWTRNYDQLSGPENRKERMKSSRRYGLTVTDCVFMSSRDGKKWKRWDEAFLTPGLEHENNWLYGDCFPALGMIETSDGISMYVVEHHFAPMPCVLRRHTIRVDGFVSYRATYKPCKIVTKPFLFEGNGLTINFSTSAIGSIRIKLVGEETALDSMEIFGDSLDRKVFFDNGDVSSLAGKPVRMEITMSDADLYSFQFESGGI